MIFSFHFFLMGSLVILVSGLISFFVKRFHVAFTVMLSMLAGYLYSIVFEAPNLAWFAIIYNGILSIITVALVKIVLYIKRKAEELGRE